MFSEKEIEGFVGANATCSIGTSTIEIPCKYDNAEIGIGLRDGSERVEKIMFAKHKFTEEITQGQNVTINEKTKTIKSFSEILGIVVLEL